MNLRNVTFPDRAMQHNNPPKGYHIWLAERFQWLISLNGRSCGRAWYQHVTHSGCLLWKQHCSSWWRHVSLSWSEIMSCRNRNCILILGTKYISSVKYPVYLNFIYYKNSGTHLNRSKHKSFKFNLRFCKRS